MTESLLAHPKIHRGCSARECPSEDDPLLALKGKQGVHGLGACRSFQAVAFIADQQITSTCQSCGMLANAFIRTYEDFEQGAMPE